MKLTRYCTVCKQYTLREQCSKGHAATFPSPPRYSPDDAYAKYQRMAKETERRERGVL